MAEAGPPLALGARLLRTALRAVRAALLPGALIALATTAEAVLALGSETLVLSNLALLLAIPATDAVLREVARGLFHPTSRRERIVPCDDASARHFHFYARTLCAVFAVFVPLVALLRRNGYPAGAVQATWLAGELLAILAIVLLLSRRSLFLAILPRSETRVGAALHHVAAVLYPLLAVYVLAILAVHGYGYERLARYLGISTLLSVAAVVAAYLVWKYISYRLEHELEREVKAIEETLGLDEAAPEVRNRQGLFGTVAALAKLVLALAAVGGVLLAWRLEWQRIYAFVVGTPLVSWTGEGGARVGITVADIITAGLVVIGTFFVGRIVRQLFQRRVLARSKLDRGTQTAIANGVFVTVLAVGIYMVLSSFEINLDALKWLGGAIGLGVGFGLQNIVNNFVSGLIILTEKPIRTDDVVDVGGTIGRVDRIGTRSTTVIDRDNIARIIPNAEFIGGRVTNWSHSDVKTRLHVRVRVAYGSEIAHVREVLLGCARRHRLVLAQPAPEVYFLDLADTALVFDLTFWIDDLPQESRIRSDICFAIHDAFEQHGIKIPFPQREVRAAAAPPLPPTPAKPQDRTG